MNLITFVDSKGHLFMYLILILKFTFKYVCFTYFFLSILQFFDINIKTRGKLILFSKNLFSASGIELFIMMFNRYLTTVIAKYQLLHVFLFNFPVYWSADGRYRLIIIIISILHIGSISKIIYLSHVYI